MTSKNDSEITVEVKDSISRHLWYLTEELIVLSLFDKELDYQSRANIATKLLSYPRPEFFTPKKPSFPSLDHLNSSIENFVGARSWLLFHLLDIEPCWLNLPSEYWDQNIQYQKIEGIVRGISVTNDTAERAVKKFTDYANSANDGGQRGKIVEVVSWHHGKMKGYNKEDLKNIL